MKQYLPVKRGFKVWDIADALNGYFYDLNVYTGACGERVCTGRESSAHAV